jgi:alkylhydroperoxidase family enzyme
MVDRSPVGAAAAASRRRGALAWSQVVAAATPDRSVEAVVAVLRAR